MYVKNKVCALPSALPLPSHRAQTTPQNLPVPHRVRSGFVHYFIPSVIFVPVLPPRWFSLTQAAFFATVFN